MRSGQSANGRGAVWLRRAFILLLPLFLWGDGVEQTLRYDFLAGQYRAGYLPPDLTGAADAAGLVPLTDEERLALAAVSLAYLQSWRQPETAVTALAAQRLPHTGAPLYGQRELDHMVDVKRRTDFIRLTTGLSGLFLLAAAFGLRRQRPELLLTTLGRGGALTLAVSLLLAFFIYAGWGLFFYQFHGLFFPAGSWHFAPTDGLMRLFPEPLFYRAGLRIAAVPLFWGCVALLAGYGWLVVSRWRRAYGTG